MLVAVWPMISLVAHGFGSGKMLIGSLFYVCYALTVSGMATHALQLTSAFSAAGSAKKMEKGGAVHVHQSDEDSFQSDDAFERTNKSNEKASKESGGQVTRMLKFHTSVVVPRTYD